MKMGNHILANNKENSTKTKNIRKIFIRYQKSLIILNGKFMSFKTMAILLSACYNANSDSSSGAGISVSNYFTKKIN